MTDTKLKVGDQAPAFTLKDENGGTVTLADYKGQRVILYFYPKDDTPGCTAQACGFRDAYPEIEEQNAVVLGISPQAEASHAKFKTKYKLPFRLLVDTDHKVAEAYGVWGEKSLYGKKFMGIVRSHFVIDEKGQLIDVQVKVSPQDSVSLSMSALKAAS